MRVGTVWELAIAQGSLEAEGIPTVLPESKSSTRCALQVPAQLAQRALEVLAERAGPADGDAGGDSGEGGARSPEEQRMRALEDLGRRIRWATTLVFTHPAVVVYGYDYLRLLRSVEGRPAGHGMTVFALVLVGGIWGALLCGLVARLWFGGP